MFSLLFSFRQSRVPRAHRCTHQLQTPISSLSFSLISKKDFSFFCFSPDYSLVCCYDAAPPPQQPFPDTYNIPQKAGYGDIRNVWEKQNKTKQKGILFLASIPVIEYVEQFLMTVEDPPCVEREKREERKEEEAGRVNPSELGVRQCGSPLTACSSFFLYQLSALSFDWCIHCVCAHSVQTDVNKYGNDCCCCCCCSCLICACCYHYTSRQFSYLL